MKSDRENLLFADFLNQQIRLRYPPGWTGEVEPFVIKTATTLHVLTVSDALNDAFIRAASWSEMTNSAAARHYLIYGAGRRLSMMRQSYRDLIQIASPERTQTLSNEETNQTNLALNVIYLHVRGVLDNLAWALLHEFAPENVPSREQEVGLFYPCIFREKKFAELSKVLEGYKEWNKDLRERRDPVAHRIPLGVTGQILRPGEDVKYQELWKSRNDAMVSLNFDQADKIWDSLHELGYFSPCFGHDPSKPIVAIYPTVPDDIGRIVTICESIHRFFSGKKI